MELRLLGEVQVLAGGQLLDAGPPRQQCVLGALAVDAGPAGAHRDACRPDLGRRAAAEARNVLYSHLSRIRQLLRQAAGLGDEPTARLERRHAGYVLDIEPDLVDLHRFTRLSDQGRDQSRGTAERARALAAALGLWRGPLMTGLPGEWVGGVREDCRRRRLDTAVHWARAELRLGHADLVTSALPGLIAEYPLAEPLECLLMEALHAAGRDAEAIDRYGLVRERLAEALGADPGQQLQDLYEAILRGEVDRARPPDQLPAAVPAPAGPAQLPPDLSGFTGREPQLRQLDAIAAAVSPAPGAAAGRGGDRGHRRDGRGGEDHAGGALDAPGGAAVPRWAALREPARVRPGWRAGAAGRGGARVPRRARRAARAGAGHAGGAGGAVPQPAVGRRVLVLLDNASDAWQVRPLLPGAPGCVTVVTSRTQLAGLVTTSGAVPVTLDLPTDGEARELLEHRLGVARVAAEPAGGRGDHRPVRAAAAGAGRRGYPGGDPARPAAGHARGRAARVRGRPGRVHRPGPGQ